jgi:hypothetical protein
MHVTIIVNRYHLRAVTTLSTDVTRVLAEMSWNLLKMYVATTGWSGQRNDLRAAFARGSFDK